MDLTHLDSSSSDPVSLTMALDILSDNFFMPSPDQGPLPTPLQAIQWSPSLNGLANGTLTSYPAHYLAPDHLAPSSETTTTSPVPPKKATTKTAKKEQRMSKKKDREKNRRLDTNTAFDQLSSLVGTIATAPPRGSTRLDLITSTIAVLESLQSKVSDLEKAAAAFTKKESAWEERERKRARVESGGEGVSRAAVPPPAALPAALPTAAPTAAPIAAPNPPATAPHPFLMVLPDSSGSTQNMMVYPIPCIDGRYTIPTASSISGIFNIPTTAAPNTLTVVSPPSILPVPAIEQEQNLWVIASSDKVKGEGEGEGEGRKKREEVLGEGRREGEGSGNLAHCA